MTDEHHELDPGEDAERTKHRADRDSDLEGSDRFVDDRDTDTETEQTKLFTDAELDADQRDLSELTESS